MTSGRAVAERGDDPFGQRRVGLGHHLGRDADLFGHSQAEERRVRAEGPQRLGLAPAHRAAHAAPARPQTNRHQRVLVVAAEVACGHPRPGKAHQKPARLDPVEHGDLLGPGQDRYVGKDDRIGVGQKDIADGPVDQIRRRLERLFEVMRGRQKLQAFAVVKTRDQRDLAPAQRIVGQGHRARRAQAVDLEPRDAVAEFGRQRQVDHRVPRARIERQRGRHQGPGRARGIKAMGVHHDFRGTTRLSADRPQCHDAIGEDRGRQRDHRARRFEYRDRATVFERRQQVAPPGMIEAVRHPEHLRTAVETARPVRHLGTIRHPGRGLQAGQALPHRLGGLKAQTVGGQVGEGDDRRRAARARGFGQKIVQPFQPPRPVARIRPCAVHHHQKRPGPFAFHLRVKDRSREAQDQRRDGDGAQQQKPPRRLVAFVVVVPETEKKGHAGKPPPDRRGRNRAQQEPQDRQRDQPQQKPGRRETYAAEGEHQ